MPLPVTPAQFKDAIVSMPASFCRKFISNLMALPKLWYDMYIYMYNDTFPDDDIFSTDFKADLADDSCECRDAAGTTGLTACWYVENNQFVIVGTGDFLAGDSMTVLDAALHPLSPPLQSIVAEVSTTCTLSHPLSVLDWPTGLETFTLRQTRGGIVKTATATYCPGYSYPSDPCSGTGTVSHVINKTTEKVEWTVSTKAGEIRIVNTNSSLDQAGFISNGQPLTFTTPWIKEDDDETLTSITYSIYWRYNSDCAWVKIEDETVLVNELNPTDTPVQIYWTGAKENKLYARIYRHGTTKLTYASVDRATLTDGTYQVLTIKQPPSTDGQNLAFDVSDTSEYVEFSFDLPGDFSSQLVLNSTWSGTTEIVAYYYHFGYQFTAVNGLTLSRNEVCGFVYRPV